MIYYTVVTNSWGSPAQTDVNGRVTFDLATSLEDTVTGMTVGPLQAEADLQFAQIAEALAANDSPDLAITNTAYHVRVALVGAPEEDFYITVPHLPAGARQVSDGVVASGQNTLTSATAAFGSGDIGKYVFCPAFPVGVQISSIASSTVAHLSAAASGTATAQVAVIGASVALSALRP